MSFTRKRRRNTDRNGQPFSEPTIEMVWKKGKPVATYSYDPDRMDTCGAQMRRTNYGDTESAFGWEIDHIVPVSKGGGDELSNLQPLQWENNRSKGDDYPNWKCAVRS